MTILYIIGLYVLCIYMKGGQRFIVKCRKRFKLKIDVSGCVNEGLIEFMKIHASCVLII